MVSSVVNIPIYSLSSLLFIVSITFLISFWLLLFKLYYLEATDIFLHFSHRKRFLSNDRNIGNMFRCIRKFRVSYSYPWILVESPSNIRTEWGLHKDWTRTGPGLGQDWKWTGCGVTSQVDNFPVHFQSTSSPLVVQSTWTCPCAVSRMRSGPVHVDYQDSVLVQSWWSPNGVHGNQI